MLKKSKELYEYINFEDIKPLNIILLECYKWLEEVIYNKNSAIILHRIIMKPNEDVFIMSCRTSSGGDRNISHRGIKIVTCYFDCVLSLDSYIMLITVAIDEFLDIMDDTWSTAMRTVVVAVHSILLFVK